MWITASQLSVLAVKKVSESCLKHHIVWLFFLRARERPIDYFSCCTEVVFFFKKGEDPDHQKFSIPSFLLCDEHLDEVMESCTEVSDFNAFF